jgi:hypothetical protein
MKKLLTLLLLTLVACSDGGSPATDPVMRISMKINGVERVFISYGRGITIQSDGSYKLDAQFYTSDTQAQPGEYFSFVMKYKRKGHNVIDQMYIFANPAGMSDNFATGTFENHVTVNNRKQITATFSAIMGSGDEMVTITDGYINCFYDPPFDN